jgi:hypothetical protein
MANRLASLPPLGCCALGRHTPVVLSKCVPAIFESLAHGFQCAEKGFVLGSPAWLSTGLLDDAVLAR